MRIAVSGATGVVGRHVVRELAAAGRHEVVALTRRREPLPHDVNSAYADYDDADSLRTALRGVDVLVFVSSDGEAARMMTHHENVARAVEQNAVANVVYLSGIDADLDSPFCYAYTNGWTEQRLGSSGCTLSVVRASIYSEFFLRFVTSGRASGEVRLPAGDGRLALVAKRDVASCMAALAQAPTGDTHDVTGPQALDINAIADVAATEWNSPMKFVDVSPAEFVRGLASEREDPWWTYAFSSMFASVRQHRWETVSDDVRVLTGRTPASFADILHAQKP